MNMLTKAGAAAGAIAALVGLWAMLGIATSADIKRLDRNQTEVAVDIYSRQLRSYLAAPAPDDPTARSYWNEEVRSLRDRLRDAESRRIELSK